MNDIDILKSIAENLSERKSSAALNNYQVLCNNIKYVNELFDYGVKSANQIQVQIENFLSNNELVGNNLKDSSKPLFYFRQIIPRILLNDLSMCKKFLTYTKADDRSGITVENVGQLSKDFIDYNNLVTSARQFIDSMVADAYQLIILDAKETNYQVLLSLNSFNKYVTKSIRQALFNTDIEASLNEFERLNFNQWSNSPITKCSHNTFAQKVNYIFSTLSITYDNALKEDIKNLFKFSSEFTHIGYVSTFFTSTNGSEVIFGDEVSPYLPSTENFSELKYEILSTAINFFSKVYLPAVAYCVRKIFKQDIADMIEHSIIQICEKIETDFKTRNNKYYFFITQGLMGSDKIIQLTCMCHTINNWAPPHDISEIYCKNCGSKFNLIEIEGDSGYVITSNGPARIIGSNAPDFSDLPIEERIEILKKCSEVGEQA